MKKFASIIIAVLIVVLCFTLTACGTKYKSNCSSTAMVETKDSNSATVSFGTFSGRYVIKFNDTIKESTVITYNATLEEGSIKVYYDFGDEKLSLFEIGTDGSVEGKSEAFARNKTVYIIIESDGKCNECSFSFALKKAE
ncbi:MAG: hypothetical protein HDT36_02395 [Clostridiales bacterium]|nr:hypothetical protein [Clostridiales bacterium]